MCAFPVSACVYFFLVYLNASCDREEKANLSQHALDPSRGQPAVKVFSNEEHY